MIGTSKRLSTRIKSFKDNSNNLEDGLLSSKIQLLDYAALKKLRGYQPSSELFDFKLSNEEMLIAELKKTTITGSKKKTLEPNKESDTKSSTINSSKNLENNNNPKRNNDIIVRCLKQYKNLMEYLKFNNISIDLLEKISPYIKHKYVTKGEYLLKDDKKVNIFFGVINGKISLRTFNPKIILENKKKNENEELNMEKIYNYRKIDKILDEDLKASTNNNKKDTHSKERNKKKLEKEIIKEIEEEEKEEGNKELITIDIGEDNNMEILEINYDNIPGMEKYLKEGYEIKGLREGDCYGVYELLNSHCNFYINAIAIENSDIFYIEKEYYDKYLLNPVSRIDTERKYIINKLIPSLPMDLLMNLQPEIYENNQILYTEYDYAFEAIYIYKGSAELKKYSWAKSKNDIYEHKNILKTISKIDEGGIAGLEVCRGPNYFYENTLITTDPKTIIYRINILDINSRRTTTRNNIKKFFSNLYEQQKIYLTKAEEKNKEISEIYNTNKKKEKPKINYSEFFNNVFKDVNLPNKIRRNKHSKYKFTKFNFESTNDSINKLKSKPLMGFSNNKNLVNNFLKNMDNKNKSNVNFFTMHKSKEHKKYTINSKKSRNEEEKNFPTLNSLNKYSTLSAPSKIKNQKQIIASSQDNNFNYDKVKNNNNKIISYIFGKESQKSDDLFFPKLFKNKSTKNNKKIFLLKSEDKKNRNNNSKDKCLYNSGDFKIPFVSLTEKNITNNSVNKIKLRNINHYSDLKKLILDKNII